MTQLRDVWRFLVEVVVGDGQVAFRPFEMGIAFLTLVFYGTLAGPALIVAAILDWRPPGPAPLWDALAGVIVGSTVISGMFYAGVDLANPSLYLATLSIAASITASAHVSFVSYAHVANFTAGAGFIFALAALAPGAEDAPYIAAVMAVVVLAPAIIRHLVDDTE